MHTLARVCVGRRASSFVTASSICGKIGGDGRSREITGSHVRFRLEHLRQVPRTQLLGRCLRLRRHLSGERGVARG